MRHEYRKDVIPNAETLESIKAPEDGNGQYFTGSTEDFFKILMESGLIDYGFTNDYMFRAILQHNNRVLKGLICSLLYL